MTPLRLTTPEGFTFPVPFEQGDYTPVLGDASRQVERAVRDARVHQELSLTHGWRGFLKDVVVGLFRERSRKGWDGYDALPLSDRSAAGAIAFIDLIPENVEIPEVVPDADGFVGFEWRRGAEAILTVSATGDGVIAYSFVRRDGKHRRGQGDFEDEIPDSVIPLLQKHFLRRE